MRRFYKTLIQFVVLIVQLGFFLKLSGQISFAGKNYNQYGMTDTLLKIGSYWELPESDSISGYVIYKESRTPYVIFDLESKSSKKFEIRYRRDFTIARYIDISPENKRTLYFFNENEELKHIVFISRRSQLKEYVIEKGRIRTLIDHTTKIGTKSYKVNRRIPETEKLKAEWILKENALCKSTFHVK